MISFRFGKKGIGLQYPVFIIAEAGSNWSCGNYLKYKQYGKKKDFLDWFERDIKLGKSLIDAAVNAKCDAIKFQTFRSTSYVKNAGKYLSKDITQLWDELSMPYELIEIFANYCKEGGIIFMSTGFSEKDVDLIDPYTPIHKVASYELTHTKLLKYIAFKGKPMIMSTGASTNSEIEDAVKACHSVGNYRVVLMQCTAKYPADLETLNPAQILNSINQFDVPSGLSDHSRNHLIGPIMATA